MAQKRNKASQVSRTRLLVEPLEERCLLDGAPPANAPVLGVVAPPAIVGTPGTTQTTPVVTPPSHFNSAPELQQYLIDQAVQAWKYNLGQHYPRYIINPGGPMLGTPIAYAQDAAAAPGATSTASAGANDFSQTNIQVSGVDEGDIVKTDGNYLYLLSGQKLVILRAFPADQLDRVSQTALEGTPSALYLTGDRLTVISQVYDNQPPPGWLVGPTGVAAVNGTAINGAAPGALVAPLGFGSPRTKVTVFDVSDPTAPRTVQETYLDGGYNTSRLIGNRLYLVLDHSGLSAPPPLATTTDTEVVYETEQQYRDRLAQGGLDLLLPGVYTRPGGAGTPLQRLGPVSQPADFYRPQTDLSPDLFSVVAFDVTRDQPGPIGSASAFGNFGLMVYASATNVYVSSFTGDWPNQTYVVDKFHLDGDQVTLTADGLLPGRPLNQYSFDEYNGYLRVATTTTTWVTNTNPLVPATLVNQQSNNVDVLAEKDGLLNVVGALTNLAPGQQIFAARFLGPRGFLVTFKQVDPLFALDLSDPHAPRDAGELHVPGFSRYLHPVGDGFLLGVGRDTDAQGHALGLQLSLFDVRDLSNPLRVAQYLIQPPAGGFSWQWSAAEWDPHAFSYFPESQTVAIPVQGSGFVDGTWQTESDLWVFHIDDLSNFRLLGEVRHDDAVLRSVRIADDLYSVGLDSVKVQPLADPGNMIAQVDLRDGTVGQIYPILPFVAVPFTGIVAAFQGVNPGPLSATIDWGNGQSTPGTVTTDAQGMTVINGSFQYDQAGKFPLTVTLTGADGQRTTVAGSTRVGGGDDERFVAQLYLDVLGRRADAAGLGYWTAALARGAGRDAVAQAVLLSPESRTRSIKGLYRSLLNREADDAGVAFFLQAFAAGATTDQVRTVILGSAEYQAQRGGGSDEGFLRALYQDALGRALDDAGKQYWSEALARGATHQELAAVVLAGAEAQQSLVRGAYRQVLGREADAPGMSFFTAGLAQYGWNAEQVAAYLLGSKEYLDRA